MTLPGRTVAIGGDLMLGRGVAERLARSDRTAVWGDLLPTLWSADLAMANLECALTRSTTEWRDSGRKAFYFRAPPAAVEVLAVAGIDVVSLANNHILDFEARGLRETIEALDGAGIAHAGAGTDRAAAVRPALADADGLRVALVACADHPVEWAAEDDRPGIHLVRIGSATDLERVARVIAGAREAADVVVLSLHWGPNMRERPPAEFRSFARAAVDAGADVVWGHSAHVVQGIEFHQGNPILYDTGELVDDYAVDPDLRNDLGALFLLHAREGRVDEVALMPLRIDDMSVRRATGEDREWFVRRITRLCAELGTSIAVAPDGRLIARAADAHRPARAAASARGG